jgi:hypothetical protein
LVETGTVPNAKREIPIINRDREQEEPTAWVDRAGVSDGVIALVVMVLSVKPL